jgi:hypothetical protein
MKPMTPRPEAIETISKSPRIGWLVAQRSRTETVVMVAPTSSDAPPRKARARARFGMRPAGGEASGKQRASGERPQEKPSPAPGRGRVGWGL